MRPYVIIVGLVLVPGVPVLVKSGHRLSILYKNIMNVHPRNWT